MKKGWIRIHVILSILLGVILPLICSIWDADLSGLVFFLPPLYWGLLYLIRFLIKWVKKGFKES